MLFGEKVSRGPVGFCGSSRHDGWVPGKQHQQDLPEGLDHAPKLEEAVWSKHHDNSLQVSCKPYAVPYTVCPFGFSLAGF